MAPHDGYAPLVERLLAERAVRSSGTGYRDVAIGSQQVRALVEYLDQVTRWNAHHDLTAARSPEELVDLFVADAAVLAGTVSLAEASAGETPSWVDVGSGAGAPGLPLAVFRSELKIQLVEPRVKRVAFLRSIVGSLRLELVTVFRGRSEQLGEGTFDMAVSRATLPPDQWLNEGARIARRAVWVLLAQAEPPELPGWQVDLDLHYDWPLTHVRRRAVRFVRSSI